MSELTEFRAQVDEFLGSHPQSPISGADRANFKGLPYFEVNADLILEVAVDYCGEDEAMVTMQTSTGDTRQYRPWGRFSFKVDGQEATLTIYSDASGQDLFLPFKDSTNGPESYGAGRYMDNHRPALVLLNSSTLRVDFNYCYSPYCAYQSLYSCPIPPRENWLKVPIRAGEKKFKDYD